MLTGYTQLIDSDPNVTLRAYALRCARAFGACVMQRDESIDNPPRHREPSTYHAEELSKAKAALAAAKAMSTDAAEAGALARFNKERDYYKAAVAERAEKLARYNRIRAEVEAWTPPSADHVGLKTFMLSQIDETIRFDHGYALDVPKRVTAMAYKAKEIESAKRDVAYHAAKDEEEVRRCREADAWIDALVGSLPGATK